jgi:hypothetical protein
MQPHDGTPHSRNNEMELQMAKPPKNSGKPWSAEEVKQLKALAKGNTPTRVMAIKLERTPIAVQAKATAEGISLKPANRSPYGTASR